MPPWSRQLGWLAICALSFVAIEAAVARLIPTPDIARSNVLEYSYARSEMLQRAFLFEKLRQFDDEKPEIIQVGDSSGLHGIQSPIVESYLGGRRYLNLSLASNLGYPGYLAVAERMMERSRTVRLLVLHFTLSGGAPRLATVDAQNLLGRDLKRELTSPFHRLFQVPSLGLRKDATDRVYYLGGLLNSPDRPLVNNPGYLMLRDIIGSSGGWARETDNPDDYMDGLFNVMRTSSPHLRNVDDDGIAAHYRRVLGRLGGEQKFDWSSFSRRSYIELVLDEFRELARRHDARLVVATNPLPESFRREAFKNAFDTDGIMLALADYARKYPEVSIQNVEYWPDEKFSVPAHVGTPYASESSHRLGRFLSPLVKDLPTGFGFIHDEASPLSIDMAGSPTIYGLSKVEHDAGRGFRRIRSGRFEALVYCRVNSETARELLLEVLNDAGEKVVEDVGVAINGAAAPRLPGVSVGGGRRFVRFSLPEDAVRRYRGWLELTISTRGSTSWRSSSLIANATGPQLRLASIKVVQSIDDVVPDLK